MRAWTGAVRPLIGAGTSITKNQVAGPRPAGGDLQAEGGFVNVTSYPICHVRASVSAEGAVLGITR